MLNMKKKTILPVGLKGNQINERMKELMGISSINENSSKVVVELTKTGPDGKSYAIIRENHEWYIKKTDKISNILAEDFKYIGGLKNKKDEAYPSYAKAIKHLNLKFKSLAEAYGFEGEINVFENDNLISESGLAGFSSEGGSGFSGEGNLEGNTPMFESEDEPKRSECCDAPIVNGDICSECKEHTGGLDEVEMSEAEKAVDAMLTTEIRGPWSKNYNDTDDITNVNAEEAESDEDESDEDDVQESRMSITEAVKNMDSLIDNLTKGLKKKV